MTRSAFWDTRLEYCLVCDALYIVSVCKSCFNWRGRLWMKGAAFEGNPSFFAISWERRSLLPRVTACQEYHCVAFATLLEGAAAAAEQLMGYNIHLAF